MLNSKWRDAVILFGLAVLLKDRGYDFTAFGLGSLAFATMLRELLGCYLDKWMGTSHDAHPPTDG